MIVLHKDTGYCTYILDKNDFKEGIPEDTTMMLKGSRGNKLYIPSEHKETYEDSEVYQIIKPHIYIDDTRIARVKFYGKRIDSESIPVEKFRATGRTTRLIDDAIQDLFINGIAVVYGHKNTKANNMETLEKVIKRLSSEHRVNHSIDYSTFTIKLNK